MLSINGDLNFTYPFRLSIDSFRQQYSDVMYDQSQFWKLALFVVNRHF